MVSFAASISSGIWHSRLGHVSFFRLHFLISHGKLGHVKGETIDCVSCKLAKHHAFLYNNSDFVSFVLFDLIHFDIWGPSPHDIMGGSKYFVIFMDDYS